MKAIFSFIGFMFYSALIAQESEKLLGIADPGPIMEPEPIPFSFEAPGWYILTGVLIATFVILFVRWLKIYRKNAYRREALKTLNKLEQQASRSSPDSILNEMMILLKRVAMEAYERQIVASLSGKAWLAYLESKGKNTPFTVYEVPISAAIYEGKAIENDKLNELLLLTKKWIKTHA